MPHIDFCAGNLGTEGGVKQAYVVARFRLSGLHTFYAN